MKRVLYLTYDGLTDPLGQSQILPYLTGLAKEGFTIDILSCEKPLAFSLRSKDVKDLLEKYDIHWEYLVYHKSPPVFSTIWDLLLMKRRAQSLCSLKEYSIIHCRSYLPALVGVGIKKKKQIKVIFDMRGFWADERIEGKIWDIKNPLYNLIYRFLKNREKMLLRKSDHIITLTEKARELIEKGAIGSTTNTPLTSIPCCVDLNLFDIDIITPELITTERESLNIPKKAFVVGYIGSIGTWYMLDEMMDFFSCLLEVKSDAIFLFITRESSDRILDVASKKGVPHQQLRITASERADIPKHIAIFDVSIFFIKPTFSKKASSPTKHAEAMAMGIPVVCNSGIGDTDSIIEMYNCGWLASEFTRFTYQEICQKVLNPTKSTLMIRKGAEEFYSLERGINLYKHVYHSILEKK